MISKPFALNLSKVYATIFSIYFFYCIFLDTFVGYIFVA